MLYFNNIQAEEMEEITMGNPVIRKVLTVEQIPLKNKKERGPHELSEKGVRDEISILDSAKAEGRAESMAERVATIRAEGKVKGRADAICTFLNARFGEASQGLQKKVRSISKIETLDKIIKQIFTAASLDDAEDIINNAT